MNEIATQIQALLKQRQQGYIDATQVLLKKLEFVTTALKDACKEHGDSEADRIQWADIQMNDEVVFIIGTIDMIPGSVVHTQDGGQITLTTETAARFQRKVVFNISFEAFTKHTPKELVDIIHQSVIISRASQAQGESQIVDNPAHSFDMTQLTPEQQQSLMSYLRLQPDQEKGPTSN